MVLDTRNADDFRKCFIPNSINIGLNGQFAPWVGELIPDLKQPILIVAEAGKERETIIRLARVGYDSSLGYLEGGIDAWKTTGKEVDTIERIPAAEFAKLWKKDETIVYDVRGDGEYEAEHIEEAYHQSLAQFNEWIGLIDKKQHFYIHCAGGYRSMMAASILKSRGYDNFTEVAGGFEAIVKEGIPKTDFMCASKTLAQIIIY